MSAYEFPYLDPHQSRTQAPTAWHSELADVMESIFAKGAHDIDALIAGLNASRVRPPNGGRWTSEHFTALMRQLGA